MDHIIRLARQLVENRTMRDRAWEEMRELEAHQPPAGCVTRVWQDAVGAASARYLAAQQTVGVLSTAIVADVCRLAMETSTRERTVHEYDAESSVCLRSGKEIACPATPPP